MKKFKEVFKDIWRNYKYPLVISWVFIALLVYYIDSWGGWEVFPLCIVGSPTIVCLIYGIKEAIK